MAPFRLAVFCPQENDIYIKFSRLSVCKHCVGFFFIYIKWPKAFEDCGHRKGLLYLLEETQFLFSFCFKEK
jgi:hypothetical protein